MLKTRLASRKLILASQSPRRKQLLEAIDLDFEVIVRSVDEKYPSGLLPSGVAEHIALAKAEVFKEDLQPDQIVITGDTVVVDEDQILGKPKNATEARAMLTSLSGKKHRVVSSLCLLAAHKIVVKSDTAFVSFKSFSNEEIDFYIENYKPYDKAGGYGIQEWLGHIGMIKLEGSYNTVMGLPTHLLYQMLHDFLNE
ncbi:MAG TPA: septum formation protein Maf [Leeuwenhoekiella sp.]|nr:septum formation protein Maf [Leeuwenhoekiella sp.]